MGPRDSEWQTTPFPTGVLDLSAKQRLKQAPATRENEQTISMGEGSPSTQHLSDIDTTAPGRATFLPGALVANRYRISRFIARGGMGEVHEAEDLELRVPVALKTIRSQIALDVRMLDRFRREIQLARQVTHPNVCRIFDIGSHQVGQPGQPGARRVLFLTMELLNGETLATYLRRTGRMTPEDARPLLRQMAKALDAAHEAGIVHRDFKSGNVLLVPSKTSSLRAVVTDFGLACSSPDSLDPNAEQDELTAFVGTPAYMAPEQVEGGEIQSAADIYAFGIVMYEMLTGVLPFSGRTPQESARKRLDEPPLSPRKHVPDMDLAWEQSILRCLARNASDRWPSAMAAVRATASGEETQPLRRNVGQRRARTAGLLASGALMMGASWLYTSKTPQTVIAATQEIPNSLSDPNTVRRSVAILGFRNLAGRADSDWLSTALGEMLGAELAAGERLRIIPGDNVNRLKLQTGMLPLESFAADTLLDLRQQLGADLVVMGSFLSTGSASNSRVRLDLKVQETASGETVASVIETGTEADLLDLVSRAGSRLRESLGLGRLSAADAQALRASLLTDPQAARLYSEGLMKLRNFDALGARELLERAAAAEPEHPLPHAALAELWSTLGHDGKAKVEGRKAYDLSKGLPRSERLLVEASWRQAAGDWPRAVRIYQTLLEFFPDNLEYGLALANVQTMAAQGNDALKTIERLREFPAPARDDPRLDLYEARASESIADHLRQLSASSCVIDKGRQQGARLLVAEGLLAGWKAQQINWGRFVAMQGCLEAYQIFREAGDRRGMSRSLQGMGYLLWMGQQGLNDPNSAKLQEALHVYQEALSLSLEIGDVGSEAKILRGIGLVLLDQQHPAEAQLIFEASMRLFREIGDLSGLAFALSSRAYALNQQEHLEEALTAFNEAFALFETQDAKNNALHIMGWRSVLLSKLNRLPESQLIDEEMVKRYTANNQQKSKSEALSNLSLTREYLGDLRGATRFAEAAIATLQNAPEWQRYSSNLGNLFFHLAGLQQDQGKFGEALENFAAAKELMLEKSPSMAEPWHQVGLGLVALQRGQSQEAFQQFLAAHEQFERLDLPQHAKLQSRAYIQARMGEALEQLGRLDEAKTAVEESLGLIPPQLPGNRPDPEVLKRQAQQVHLLLTRGGQAAKAESLARELLQKTIKQGWVLEQDRMRFLLGWALLERGKAEEAKQELERAVFGLQNAGYRSLELEARVQAIRAEMRTGKRSAALNRLDVLEREARQDGFEGIVRKIAQIRK